VFAVEVLELSDEIGRSTGTWSRSRAEDLVRFLDAWRDAEALV
jgi:hypothetical protein